MSIDRDVHLPVAAQSSLDDFVALATTAERLGYDRAWFPETWGRDAVTVLATAARETDRIGLGTSVVPVFSRSPALLGQTAATLQEASDGRFRLGVGPSGPAVVEHWHGQDFDRPLRRTRETVEVVRQVLTGETVSYHGDIFDLEGFRLRCDPPDAAPSIDVAAMGPKAVELAGRFGDGWHALMFTPDGLRERATDLERGADLGDRNPDEVRTSLVLPCCVSEGDHGERARRLVRRHLAFYIGGMGTFYRDALARQGYEATATQIHDAWQAGDREAAVGGISESLLTDIAVAGTPAEARKQFERFAGLDVVDAVTIAPPRGADRDDIERTLEALVP